MALVLKTAVTRNAAGTELYIEFLNATGAYDDPTNLGGFGAPNVARESLAMIYYGLHKTVEEDIVSVPTAHDPLTATSFTIPLTRDNNGHLNYYVWGLPIFDDQLVYADGDIVYDNENPSVPFIKERVAGQWVTITSEDLVDKTVAIYKEGNVFPVPVAESFRMELNGLRLEKLRLMVYGECTEEEYTDFRNAFDYVDSELEEAINDFCSGSYAEAQQKLENIFEYQDHRNAA
jgi:hypothetical protein